MSALDNADKERPNFSQGLMPCVLPPRSPITVMLPVRAISGDNDTFR